MITWQKLFIRYAAVLFAALLAPLPATAVSDAAKMREVVDAAIQPILAEHQVPGLAVAITVDGRTFFFNYGVASRETNKPVNEATLFELGSVSKTFTATLGLFGRITGLALQREFADAVETELLPRLGLGHTYIRVPPSAMADYAWGYDRFVQLNLNTSGLEEPVRRAVDATHKGYFEVGGMVQGLGWEQYPYPVLLESLLKGNSDTIIFDPNVARRVTGPLAGPRLFNKTGSTGGFGAYVAFVPQQRVGIVMLANRSYPIAVRVRAAFAILSWLATSTK